MLNVFSTPQCQQCRQLKAKLKESNIEFTEIDVSDEAGMNQLLAVTTESKTLPIMTDGDIVWSGLDCLVAVEEDEI
jgi:glutaredoxin